MGTLVHVRETERGRKQHSTQCCACSPHAISRSSVLILDRCPLQWMSGEFVAFWLALIRVPIRHVALQRLALQQKYASTVKQTIKVRQRQPFGCCLSFVRVAQCYSPWTQDKHGRAGS